MNTFGHLFTLTTAGESHGEALTAIVDGMPAGIRIDRDELALQMARRAPGTGIGSTRREPDRVRLLSGLRDDVTIGTPIALLIENSDVRPGDYSHLKHTFRPSHADYTYQAKYGIRAVEGGGRASARETALRVAAGALAMQALAKRGVSVHAYTSQIGRVSMPGGYEGVDYDAIYTNAVYCPDADAADRMIAEIESARAAGDTLGGIVNCIIDGLPAGIGEPVYDKLQAMLASAMMSINAAHGFEYGMGFAGAAMRGSEALDKWTTDDCGRLRTVTNHSGGIQGGISNGMPVTMRVAFKPVATLMRPVESVNLHGESVTIKPRGRHDCCVVPRAVAVVRAMAAITTLDAILMAGKW